MSAPIHVVVMGVSGSGKTTLARGLADRMGWDLLEGDDLHPPANVTKMAAGRPLTDDDRRPWLEAIGRWIDARAAEGTSAAITCSALRRRYRETLDGGRPTVRFCHVTVDPAVLRDRVEHRRGHWMPAALLPSQLALLEPLQPDEPGVTIQADTDPVTLVDVAVRRLGLPLT